MTVAQQADKIIQLATLIRSAAKHAEPTDPKLTEAIRLLSQVGSEKMAR